jgi:enoyl-[acyl-carrier protein] reductase II
MMNRIQTLFGVQWPIVQAGMIWCSGWELASAVSNAGGLGVIGAGSMYPEVLRDQILKCQAETKRPFAVNVPLIYPSIDEHMETIMQLGVPVVFTSAGSPEKWTSKLQAKGIRVVHVVSSVKFARKAEAAGVDAIVAEGFEAGGHNGREETTTFCLVPAVAEAVKIPVIAAGGIHDGRTTLAAFALGAEAVQIGSRFVVTPESSAHQAFKDRIMEAGDGETLLRLKDLTPVRLLDNPFSRQVAAAEQAGAGPEELRILLGRGRAKRGMFEGDVDQGELEIGQVSGQIKEIQSAADIIEELVSSYQSLTSGMEDLHFCW